MRVMVSAALWGDGERSDNFGTRLWNEKTRVLCQFLPCTSQGFGCTELPRWAHFHAGQRPYSYSSKSHGMVQGKRYKRHRLAPSPDLNTIEHAWKQLKHTCSKMFPEHWKSDGTSKEDPTAMEEALKETWGTIPVSFFEELIECLERRIAMCIAANEWRTKYWILRFVSWLAHFVREALTILLH